MNIEIENDFIALCDIFGVELHLIENGLVKGDYMTTMYETIIIRGVGNIWIFIKPSKEFIHKCNEIGLDIIYAYKDNGYFVL